MIFDILQQFENICDVETDKAVAEIPSTHDGIVRKLHYNVDDVCQVGHFLADIELDDDGTSPQATSDN